MYHYKLEDSYKWFREDDGLKQEGERCESLMDRLHYSLGLDYLWVLHDRLLWTNSVDLLYDDYRYHVEGFEPIEEIQHHFCHGNVIGQ